MIDNFSYESILIFHEHCLFLSSESWIDNELKSIFKSYWYTEHSAGLAVLKHHHTTFLSSPFFYSLHDELSKNVFVRYFILN